MCKSIFFLFSLVLLFCVITDSVDAVELRKVYQERPVTGDEVPLKVLSEKGGGKISSPSRLLQVGTIVDSTIYDYQCNGTLFSRIAVIDEDPWYDAGLHITAMVSPDQNFFERGMRYIYYYNGYFTNFGYVEGDGTGNEQGGFGSVVGYGGYADIGNVAVMTSNTNLAGRPFGAHWYSFQDVFQGLGAFYPFEGPWGDGTDPCDRFGWPSLSVMNDSTGNMAMVGMTIGPCSGGFDDIKVTHKTFQYDNTWGDPVLLDTLDDSLAWAAGPEIPMIAGADNGLMGIVSTDFGTNVYYWQSTDGGITWGDRVSITGFPIDPHKVPPDTSSNEYRPLQNAAVSVSPEGVPHVVWTAYQAQGDPVNSIYVPGEDPLWQYRTKLEHWDPVHGVRTVYRHPVGLSDVAFGTAFSYNVGHPSIGFGETGDVVYVVYEGFVDSDQDPYNGLHYGDIYVSVSTDGGMTWRDRVNVTGSPGSDDLYPAIARTNLQGAFDELDGFDVGNPDGLNDFIMIYQNDDRAGTYFRWDEPSANWDMLLVAPVDFEWVFPLPFLLWGPYPGEAGTNNFFQVGGATPGEWVKVIHGLNHGTSEHPDCEGVMAEIEDPIVVGSAIADSYGVAVIEVFVPEKASGRNVLFQAIQMEGCKVSNLIEYMFP
jgi:hypothetical protein